MHQKRNTYPQKKDNKLLMNQAQYNNIIMEYQKISYQLENGIELNASNQPSKFRKKNWVEIYDESRRGYTTGSDIKFKIVILRSSLCDYTDPYILVKETITITGAGHNDAAKRADERNKCVIFKNCVPSIKSIIRINATEVDNAQDIDTIMLMHNLVEYSDNQSKKNVELYGSNTKKNQMITQQTLNHLNLK